jgi:hypothetical protein
MFQFQMISLRVFYFFFCGFFVLFCLTLNGRSRDDLARVFCGPMDTQTFQQSFKSISFLVSAKVTFVSQWTSVVLAPRLFVLVKI